MTRKFPTVTAHICSGTNSKSSLSSLCKSSHSFLYEHKPDVIVINETWLKPSILDSEVLPEIYKLWREDRSEKTHPWDPSQPKKFRKGGGGVLIACRRDIDVECTKVGFIKVQAEILSVNMKLASGKRLNISTFYRVGNLGNENFDEVQKFLTALASKKKLDKHILIGDVNFPEVTWPDPSTSNQLHKNFINLLIDDLGHSQMINEPTHKDGNILDLLFTNISDMVSNISVLGRNEACMSDHFGVKFKTNLNISNIGKWKSEVFIITLRLTGKVLTLNLKNELELHFRLTGPAHFLANI